VGLIDEKTEGRKSRATVPLKGHWHEKVCNWALSILGGCLVPSGWTATIYKHFLIVPFKATIFEQFTFTILIEILFFATPYFIKEQTRDHRSFCNFTCLSFWGSRQEEVLCLLQRQGGSEKMAVLLSPWQAADQFFSGPCCFPVPVAQRRTNFSPIRAQGVSDFTWMRWRMNATQLLKSRSENFLNCRRLIFKV
jgi:hypothetical protein